MQYNTCATEYNMKEDFMGFCYAYVDDLECDSVIAELDLWERRWSNQACLPKTALQTLQVMDKVLFPNITKMLKIMCTLPVNVSASVHFQHLRG